MTISLSIMACAVQPSHVMAEETAPPGETVFSSVEERRIHATLQEERANIFEEKKALALREKELKTLEQAVDKKLAEIDIRLEELKKSRLQLIEILKQKDSEEIKKIQNLSKIYEKMDPVKAALALSGLDQQLAADLLANMKVKAAAKILDSLNKPQATEISTTFSTIQLE
jgi:flagellar motility protein MotE (MotC chaperone)